MNTNDKSGWTNVETINGLIPFDLKGDQQKFEDSYILYFIDKGFSEKDARDVVSSIWLFANDQWSKGCKYGRLNPEWTQITDDPNSLPPSCTVVLGYNPKWVDEDFEPEGIRECFMDDDQEGWNSCKWDNDQDTWWNDTETKPTHWMQRPQPPQTKNS